MVWAFWWNIWPLWLDSSSGWEGLKGITLRSVRQTCKALAEHWVSSSRNQTKLLVTSSLCCMIWWARAAPQKLQSAFFVEGSSRQHCLVAAASCCWLFISGLSCCALLQWAACSLDIIFSLSPVPALSLNSQAAAHSARLYGNGTCTCQVSQHLFFVGNVVPKRMARISAC